MVPLQAVAVDPDSLGGDDDTPAACSPQLCRHDALLVATCVVKVLVDFVGEENFESCHTSVLAISLHHHHLLRCRRGARKQRRGTKDGASQGYSERVVALPRSSGMASVVDDIITIIIGEDNEARGEVQRVHIGEVERLSWCVVWFTTASSRGGIRTVAAAAA